MKRRTFIKATVSTAVIGGLGLNISKAANRNKKSGKETEKDWDLVICKGGTPEEMFDIGISALGGINNFVKKGDMVVVKPNIGWARAPEAGANTNPNLIKRIVEQCFKAGAKRVYVFDHTCNSWRICYRKSGIENAAKSAGAKVVCGNNRRDYKPISLPHGKKLKKTMVHKLILDCDVFINVPVLKNHGGAIMTCAMKNFMGIVWDRGYFHRNDLQQCIADSVTIRKPDLNVVDAFRVMTKGGPRGRNPEDVLTKRTQLLSTDIVAVDTAASEILGIESSRIPHLRLGEELKLGTTQLNKLKIKKIKV